MSGKYHKNVGINKVHKAPSKLHSLLSENFGQLLILGRYVFSGPPQSVYLGWTRQTDSSREVYENKKGWEPPEEFENDKITLSFIVHVTFPVD